VNENQIAQFVTETGITYPILQDESTGGGPGGFGGVTYDEYYIPNQGSPYPRDFIVDQNGILVYANNEIDTEYMIYILEVLLAGEELVVDNPVAVPFQFELFPAYPNPFNPSTTIRFNFGVGDAIMRPLTLTVYDLTGRVVDELVSGELGTGEHELVWGAAGQSSGIYFARLQSGSKVQSQKLILIK